MTPRGGGEAEAREARPDLNAILEACRAGTHRFGRLAPGQDGEWWIHAFPKDPVGPALIACIESPAAVRAAYRDEVMAEMDRWIAAYPPDIDHLGKVQPAGETLRLMLPRVKASLAALTPRPTEDG